MRGNADSDGDDDEVLDNVLAFERGDEESCPCFGWQQEKRHECRDHMEEQERYDDALEAFDNEHDADEAFEQSEPEVERIEWKEGNGLGVKLLDHGARRRESHELQESEPEKYNKK